MTLASIALALTNVLLYAITPNHDGNYLRVEKLKLDQEELSPTRWWGRDGVKPDEKIYEHKVTFSDEMINDLRARLNTSINAPRTFTKALNAGFMYGFNPSQTLTWLKYWHDEYDFKAQEKFWNTHPMYKTNVQGIDIVYIRISPPKDTKKEVVPMMLLHGFPSSIREFFDAIPMLTAESEDRDWVMDLIIPSLPGFGFSSPAAKPGMGAAHYAVVLRNFMRRLGYKKFYAQGGDFGSRILHQMVTIFPDEMLGFHTNWGHLLSPDAMFLQIAGSYFPSAVVPAKTASRMYPLQAIYPLLIGATGYMHMHATKPGSMGVYMSDSPAALTAYVLELYATAVHKMNIIRPDGGLFNDYKQDYLIDTLMYYWTTNSLESAMRIYADTFDKKHAALQIDEMPTTVPTWIVQDAEEVTYQSPLILGLKFKNALKFDVWDIGGHFMARELPGPFSKSVLEAITAFRAWHVEHGTDTNVLL